MTTPISSTPDSAEAVNVPIEFTDLEKAILTIAHYELQYTSLQNKARAVIDTRRPFSSHQSAVLTETLDELKIAAFESKPAWPELTTKTRTN